MPDDFILANYMIFPEINSISHGCRAAQRHADDMASRDYFNNMGPDGKNTVARIGDAGVRVGNGTSIYWGEP